jgi:hypothetical protein
MRRTGVVAYDPSVSVKTLTPPHVNGEERMNGEPS